MSGLLDRAMARIQAYSAGEDDRALAVIDNLFCYAGRLMLVLVLLLVLP